MELFEDFRKCKAISTKTANEKPSNNKGAVQTTIDQRFTNATFYGKTSKRHKELTDAVTRFLANVKDMMAVNTVSKEGFVGLINKLDRRYQLPSRNNFLMSQFHRCMTLTTEPYELHRSLSYSRL